MPENHEDNFQENTNKIDFPFICSIPYDVMSDKSLKPNAKLHFGCLVALSKKGGYCYATDEELAKMHGVNERQIRRWHDGLEKNNHIITVLTKVQYRDEKNRLLWKTKRKIYVSSGFKKFSEQDKKDLSDEQDKKDLSIKGETLKYKKKDSKKEKSSNAINFNKETKKFENITPEDIKKWKEVYPSVHIENELRKCEDWAIDNERKNYRGSIRSWFENVQKKNTSPFVPKEEKPQATVTQEDIDHNRKISQGWEKQLQEKGISQYAIYAKMDKTEFLYPNGESLVVLTGLSKEEYLKACNPAILRMKLK